MSQCEMCRLEVATKPYADGSGTKHELCEFCASSLASNAVFQTLPAATYYLLHAIFYVGHRIIRELRDLRRELKRDGVIRD